MFVKINLFRVLFNNYDVEALIINKDIEKYVDPMFSSKKTFFETLKSWIIKT